VVSQPDGTTGGVVQYDLGKAKANGGWERKGSLDKPPSVLLHALASLQAEHEIGPSKVPDLLQAMLEANPGMRRPKTDFTYQGAENDRLFKSKHDHVGGRNCDKCDSAWEVERDQRLSTEPEIHYGVIASGNKLVKDAATRDSLLEDTENECLCLEMEAAGLMDRFPCLVIRGICDYADSHKNDRWQRYAAATAAAFAVELLETSINKIDHHITLDRLQIAEGASFDSKAEEHNPTCLPDTRVELLRDIERWIDDQNSKTIFWLNGMAGTGKSTISRTVAQMRHKHGDLGASFFFKRGEADRGSLSKFVPTLARQLAWSTLGAATFIKSAVEADPAIADKAVRDQFERLVREPLSRATSASLSRPSVVIVVDALDECEKDADVKLLLELFSSLRFVDSLRVRVLITSRPELAIRLGFFFIEGTYKDLILQEIPHSIIEHDISVFLRHELASIRNNFNKGAVDELKLSVPWPGESNLRKLTRAAMPLFIYAATICRFVNDSYLGSPDELLQSVLHRTGNNQASKLDMTYSPVLMQQVVNRSGRERCDIIESFRLIIGTIITLASPLPMHALALLLNVHVNRVATRLRVLHSVLEVPESLDLPVRLFHLSFRDYLVDLENREAAEFWVDEVLAHRKLAKHCLRVMRGVLRENICGLSFPEGHSEWVDSVVFSHDSKKVASASNDETIRIWDAETGKYERVLEGHSWSVSSVVFSHDSKKVASASNDETIRIWDAETGKCERVLEGHSSKINSVVFSHDSKKLASASNDKTIRIWNAETGKCKQTLEGHSEWVNSVVFSHDSKKLASGSKDKTIRIWDAETGECKQVLEGHSDEVSSVVFSHDSKNVVSGSWDKTVWVWDTETGKCERVLEGHKQSVNSVVFSHDSKKVASASNDETIRIWDAETGKYERVLEGHSWSVSSVVFSHDSKKVASGSWDKTIRIWDAETGKSSASRDKTIRIWNAETGKCERVLKGHGWIVNSVVFSHDSKKLASASHDKTIRIWNAETGKCERVLKGHSWMVNLAVFSYDSKKLASGSKDKTIRIWDAETGECKQVLEGHSDEVHSVVFSCDSKKVASGSYDNTIRIWDAETGDCKRVLEGHTNWVKSVVFSHDSKKVASGSSDNTIRFWNAETGQCEDVVPLDRHVNVLSFTPDDRGIVTNHGVFALIDGLQSRAGPAMPWQSSEIPILDCIDSTWVATAGNDLLWLPPECRNGTVTVSGSTVAVGCQSGRVVFLRISMADVEQCMDI
ncbi:Vegetative incompatibility protein HET-E-1, partial [Fusarium oxysporum]